MSVHPNYFDAQCGASVSALNASVKTSVADAGTLMLDTANEEAANQAMASQLAIWAMTTKEAECKLGEAGYGDGAKGHWSITTSGGGKYQVSGGQSKPANGVLGYWSGNTVGGKHISVDVSASSFKAATGQDMTNYMNALQKFGLKDNNAGEADPADIVDADSSRSAGYTTAQQTGQAGVQLCQSGTDTASAAITVDQSGATQEKQNANASTAITSDVAALLRG